MASELENALRRCLGCIVAAETEGLHEVIAELRNKDELTDRLIDLVERRLLFVRDYVAQVGITESLHD